MYDVFSLPDIRFPKGFLWGSATAGHQIEGDNIHSDCWEREKKFAEKSGKACNSYELFREDVRLIKELGHQAYRFSLEWSRIEPEEGRIDRAALDHYKELAGLLRANGIRTFITLQHLSLPQWFAAKGGFDKRENIEAFLKFVRLAVTETKDYADYYLISNERNYTGQALDVREYQDGARRGFNYIIAHGRAYHLIKSLCSVPVSSAHMAVQPYPNRYYDELDRTMTAFRDWGYNGCFLHAIRTGELIAPFMDGEDVPELKNALDFWAINLYTREIIDSRRPLLTAPRFPHKKLRMIDLDFYLEEMYPEGMTAMLERFRDRPVYITENGCSCNDDRFRIVYLSLYLSAIHDAMQRGVDVRSYLYWSLMDNYEWTSFLPRFGLVDVDFETFKRTKKPSALFFKDIIEQNGFTQKILRKYLHELPILGLK